MTYRVALTYHPHIGTFRGKRGAWRVHWSSETMSPTEINVLCDGGGLYLSETRGVMFMPSARLHRAGTWVNPLKILKEYQSTKRSNA